MLRNNQIKALKISQENDFSSGVHFHATGAGKSWIALEIISQFNEKYKNKNIFWICEQKSILMEQFNKNTLKDKGYTDIGKKFLMYNYCENKDEQWVSHINSSKFWNKAKLIIINRAFLTSQTKYQKINLPIDLIIHDECHSIGNSTTQQFYEFIQKINPSVRCIGFSATPNLDIAPFDKTLSCYSIYDAVCDNVILPPVIKWFTSSKPLGNSDIVDLVMDLIQPLPYKKIIVWCGMIELCYEIANLWETKLRNFAIAVDTSLKDKDTKFYDYDTFSNLEGNAILFCASKHREGSDIKNLDCCVFLDKVDDRSPKVFTQCMGRVLRKDKQNNKTCGLIIDVKAKNSYSICEKVNQYLFIDKEIFPWDYSFQTTSLNNKFIKMHSLQMNVHKKSNKANNQKQIEEENNASVDYLKKMFVRNIPTDEAYTLRLKHELDLLHRKNLIPYLLRAMQILDITQNIPHVTRGSCGSSLTCYLLGITHVDPVKYNINFARFLNEYRSNLPDIDFDFPYNLRDEVFLKIELKWPGRVARISNHVYFHEKSAVRQAIRNAGIRKFIGKNDLHKEIALMSPEDQKFIKKETKKLENTFRGYSLHCGGIVYYPEGVPQNLILHSNKNHILPQINLNKINVAEDLNFKIDILSSRALAVVFECQKYQNVDFDEFTYDQKTFDMIASGDNIGLILAESPLMRKAFMKVKPKSIYDLAICMAIIRPAAKDARDMVEINPSEVFIFDDDAIDIISKELKCSMEDADKYRRAFAKRDKTIMKEFENASKHMTQEKKKELLKKLRNLSKYSFCKAHAFSYAQLIWKLAYHKCHNTTIFWKAVLNHAQSSYKKWVHYYQAQLASVDVENKLLSKNDVSIYATNRRKKINTMTALQQLKNYGYWQFNNTDFFPNCFCEIQEKKVVFNGIIACARVLTSSDKNDKNCVIFVGVAPHHYIEVIAPAKQFNSSIVGITGVGIITPTKNDITIQMEECNYY